MGCSAALTWIPTPPPAPTVSTVAVTSSPATGNTYERGENIEVTVTFSAAVDVTGTPRLALTVGGDTRQASHNRGSGAAAQVFRYTVVRADSDPDGISIGGNALSLNSGTINVANGSTAATLTHSAVSAQSGHRVNGALPAAPTVSTVAVTSSPATGNTYERGENIEVTVTFSAAVDVTGTPRLALTVGGDTRQASHNRGSGAAAQVFRYTVVRADSDPDGISIGGNALSLNSGTINVANGSTAATLTHSAVSAQSGHRVNGALPTDPDPVPVPAGDAPGPVSGITVRSQDDGLFVSWSAATGAVNQYRITATEVLGGMSSRSVRRARQPHQVVMYTEPPVTEILLDRLRLNTQYSVTVAALSSDGSEGPTSEPVTEMTGEAPSDGGADPDVVEPVPAIPFAAAVVLAALLVAAGVHRRRGF